MVKEHSVEAAQGEGEPEEQEGTWLKEEADQGGQDHNFEECL